MDAASLCSCGHTGLFRSDSHGSAEPFRAFAAQLLPAEHLARRGSTPPYHRETRREARARAGSRGHETRARKRESLKTSDRAWSSLAALVCPLARSTGVWSLASLRRAVLTLILFACRSGLTPFAVSAALGIRDCRAGNACALAC